MEKKLLVLVPICLVMSGCVSSRPFESSDSISITSTPSGALATTNYGDSCRTPCKLRLLSGSGGTVTVEKEGFEVQEIEVGVRRSGTKTALTATDSALLAADPDPLNILLSGLDRLIDGRGQTHKIDLRDVHVVMQELTPATNTDELEIGSRGVQYAETELPTDNAISRQ